MNWQLHSHTIVEDQYTLQKATTTFGGRRVWVAWFSKDVNVSEDPYKFRRLPGVIFQIEDDKKIF